MDQVFVNKKSTKCKTSRTLQIDVFKIPDNRSIGKLFSKYELLFLDQANSSSDASQLLMLKFPKTRASLPPWPCLSYFTLINWNLSSTQSSSCSLSVSLFYLTPLDHTLSQKLNKLNHMSGQLNQIFYQAIYRS